VGGELAITLNDARAVLEQFAEGEGSPQLLERCAALLHTARGVLQITETWGASLLAEEMEQTCRHLLKNRRDGQADDGIEALSRAAVQLPGYVDRIRDGGRDVPLVLLPLLNDLRAARGRPLLSESTLLLLNIAPGAMSEPVAPPRTPSGEDAAVLAKNLRPRFQLALLGWIRGDSGSDALHRLQEVADRLEAASAAEVVHQLWWVVGGVLEALVDGGLEAGVSVKRLIGQADREMKRLHTLGEQKFVAQPPVELVNNLLYYVARATSSGSRVVAIREAFSLSGLIPGDEQLESARQSLSAPSAKLMQTVSGAIREDLARVKDVLDIYVRTGMERVEELAPQVELLKKIGDTLGVLGLGELREIVQVRRAELEELVAGRSRPDESVLVSMATALLEVEDRIEPLLIGMISPDAATADGASGSSEEPGQRLVTQAVMRECLANLMRVKEAISVVTERGGDGAALDTIPTLLRGITAALLIAEREPAARIAERIAAAASEVVQRGTGPEARAALERLADAIVSLEYYMETIQAGRREPEWMLENASRSLEALMLPEISVPDGGEDLPATQVIAPPFRPDAGQPVWTGPSADRPVVTDPGDGIDPEILELFIEEAREAIESININFPRWALDDSEQEALRTVRRAYHTLKGSGRMVGAELIGEYCWSVEHLLNRIIDGTVLNSQALSAFMQRANIAVAELLEQLEVGAEPSSDIAALMAEAESLGRPEAAPEAEAPIDSSDATEVLPMPSIEAALGRAKVAPAEEPEPTLGSIDATMVATHISMPPSGMDPVLLDILSREVAAHLAVLRDFVAAGSESLRQPLPEDVFRACHTLHGNLTMAGVTAAVDLSELLNDLVGVLYAGQLPADQAGLDACGESVEVIAAVIVSLSEPTHAVPDAMALKARLQQLSIAAAERAAAQSAEPGDGGTVSMQLPVISETGLIDVSPELAEIFADDADAEGLQEPETGPEAEMDVGLEPEPETGPEARTEPVLQPDSADSRIPATTTLAGYDEEVAAIYAEEASEILEVCDLALARLSAGQDQDHALAELQRGLHTLKGGARMAGLFAMGDLSHELETLLTRVSDGLLPDNDATTVLVRAAFDELHALRDAIPAGAATAAPATLMARLAAALRGEFADQPAAAPVATLPDAEPPEQPVEEESAVEEALAGDEALADDEQPVVDLDEPLDFDLEADLNEMLATEAGTGLHFELPPVDEETPAAEETPTAADDVPAAEEVPVDEETSADEVRPVAEVPAEEAAAEDEMTAGETAEDVATVFAGPAVPPPTLERLGELARQLEAPPVRQAMPEPQPSRPSAQPPRTAEPRDFARVDSGLLEQLLNGAGEISIANARLTQQQAQIQFNLEELNQTVVRLRDQLRKLEIETEAQILYRHQAESERETGFDPLELDRYSTIQQLSRALAETANDVSSLKDLLQNVSADAEGLLVQQARTTTELQDGLMRTRMVPFDQHGSRLARLVRQTAKEQGKLAELSIEGSGDLDRQVLEKMLPPFEHMLRNAVIHGMESPAEREILGKPAAGAIRIMIRREGAEVVIDIADDGRGLDIAAIRRKAVDLGFAASDTPLTDEEAMQFILRSGFSTADQLTQAAGRGIGMDVVANQVAKFGGTLSISSRRGLGTTFSLRLPFTLAVTQALIVRTGSELYALPLPTVEGIIRIGRSEFNERMQQAEPAIDYAGQRYFFRHLGQFLGLGPSRLPDEQDRISIILVRAGDNSTALITDEMLDSREIVVKPVGALLATIRGVSGATILGDGRIVVILDVGALVRSARPAPDMPAPVVAPESMQPLALVVDDSITMRRVTQRLLERNGFRVLTAKDGVEAVGVLQDHRPDIILLDVEMPRMDGYEFARHVRNNADTVNVPIIMITSRVSEKHRARAIEIGVNDYLGKPYHERELMEAVQQQLASV
jgi:chemosensory pili system protein ChpA (sensor histidine kinase/response regulator)